MCENQLDDLEEWLMVFSSKLSNMRHDIHAIEVCIAYFQLTVILVENIFFTLNFISGT